MVQRQLFIIHRQGPLTSNSPDLSPLDYSTCDELAHAVNWDKVTSKTSLIIEVKRVVGKIHQQVVFESCVS